MRALALSSLALLLSCGSPCGPEEAEVTEVVDGDTITLKGGEKIRYLLVDTPEVTQGKNECYGAEAREFNRSLVEAMTVRLRYDPAQCKDRFERKLAYVSVEGREVNSLIVERGFGCVLHIPPAGDGRKEEFESLQSQAKAERRGLWGACTPAPCG